MLSSSRIHQGLFQGFTEQLTNNGVYLLQQLELNMWVLFEQQEHEKEADGQSVRSCDHHLQHALPHVLSRQLTVALKCTKSKNETTKISTFTSENQRARPAPLPKKEKLRLTWAKISSAVKLMLSSFSACSISFLFRSTRLSIASWSSWLRKHA